MFSLKSSSFFTLNSDKFYNKHFKKNGEKYFTPKSFLVKYKIASFFWIIFNYIQNKIRIPYLNKNQKIKIQSFSIESNKIDLNSFKLQENPSRYLCDLFWVNQDWNQIRNKLGGKIKLFDIGCGNGIYLEKMIKFAGDIQSYDGIDTYQQKSWEELNKKYPFANFHNLEGTKILDLLEEKKPNFIFSQSCLEHIEEDKKVLMEINRYAERQNQPIIQYHLIPSENCLFLFGPHGVRTYSKNTIDRLLEKINFETTLKIFSLGGTECIKTHKKFVGKIGLFGKKTTYKRRKYPEEYMKSLKYALIKDLSKGPKKNPNFYVLNFESK